MVVGHHGKKILKIMIGKRFIYDKKSCIKLSDIQKDHIKKVEDKISLGKYKFEKTKCHICYSEDFTCLSEKDRYGLKMSVVICEKCGLIQTNPRMDELSYNKFYKNEYRNIYESGDDAIEKEFQKEVNRGNEIFEYIIKNSEIDLHDKFIVEIGTGAGGILKKFQDEGNRILGVDFGQKYIEFGLKNNLNLKIGSIEIIEDEREKPDVVILSHVVEHFLEPIKMLTRVRKLIKEEGIVYIEVPGIKNLENSYEQDFLKYLQNAHAFHFTLNTLKNCCKRSGLVLIKGNQVINSLFRCGEEEQAYTSEFNEMLEYLGKIEKNRKNLINNSRMKKSILSRAVNILEKTKTKDTVKKFYKISKD